jgi:RNA recognition motif-containing protein
MQNKWRDCLNSFKELTTTVLLVNNVSRNLSKAHLQEIFSQYGPLKGVYIPKDEDTKFFKNYAYLEYVNKVDAEKACDYMGEGQIDGLKIRITILHPPDETKILEDKSATQTGDILSNQNSFQNKESSYNRGYSRRRRSRSRSRSKRKSNDYKNRHYDSRRYYKSRSRSRSKERRYSKKRDNHYTNAVGSSRSSSHSSNHKSEKYEK